MSLRPLLVSSHRWVGLISAVVLVIAGLTGALAVFPFPQAQMQVIIDLHVNLFAGEVGRWVVVAASVTTLLLQASGLWLWWPSKSLRIRRTRGSWRFNYDLHNWIGVVALPLMFILAATAVGRVVFRLISLPDALRLVPRAVGLLHHGEQFPAPFKVFYIVGGVAFVLQAATGVWMWWRSPAAGRAARVSQAAPSPD